MQGKAEKRKGCELRLDRIVLGVNGDGPRCELPAIKGFKTVKDTRVRPQGATHNYGRVRRLDSTTDAASATIQYKKRAPFLRDARVTAIADDRLGLGPDQLNNVSFGWQSHAISLVELAFDFHPEVPVDREYVLRHARFGKSRRRIDHGGPEALRFGTRSSHKLVRTYYKKEIRRFRVELEIHAPLLRKFGIRQVRDLPLIVTKLWPTHICFQIIQWRKLEAHLARRYGLKKGRRLCEEARARAERSLQRAMRFLSRYVHNPHRFLRPSKINRHIHDALERWARRFGYDAEIFSTTE